MRFSSSMCQAPTRPELLHAPCMRGSLSQRPSCSTYILHTYVCTYVCALTHSVCTYPDNATILPYLDRSVLVSVVLNRSVEVPRAPPYDTLP